MKRIIVTVLLAITAGIWTSDVAPATSSVDLKPTLLLRASLESTIQSTSDDGGRTELACHRRRCRGGRRHHC